MYGQTKVGFIIFVTVTILSFCREEKRENKTSFEKLARGQFKVVNDVNQI